ncbi:uncharacterized protein LOC122312642 [Carya illinoinensis]|uniref:uncharacterized protein LOC122312642 n=1 Tax=Carya illinoinensis TaxID=32201 RepID=UPI001C71B569|nr:uncharacterized protein LOC122312642 [Carya illinoinensis]
MIHKDTDDREMLLTGFYGSPQVDQRENSWNLLRALKPNNGRAWVCAGDFNEILNQHEKAGAAMRPYGQMQKFRGAVDDCGLSDLGFRGNKFTWSNNRETNQFTKERLDRGLGNSQLSLMFSYIDIYTLSAQSSDHSPLFVSMSNDLNNCFQKRHLFRYECSWDKKEECRKIVEEEWRSKATRGSKLHSVLGGLTLCRKALTRWKKICYKNNKELVLEHLQVISRLQEENMGQSGAVIKEKQKAVDQLLAEDDLRWKQRAKQRWLQNGDRNTRYFHMCANQRRKTNRISKVEGEDGSLHTNPTQVAGLFQAYYEKLFASSQPAGIGDCLQALTPKVTEEMNTFLCKDFVAEEVRVAVFQMNPLSSPGPDGFNAGFYQAHWQVVGEDVSKAVLDFLNLGRGDLHTINDTFIVLIPKKKDPSKGTDYRPISLCNVIYKVISKVIAHRSKKVLPALVSPNQSAFIPGRLIMDNVMVAYEAMHSMNNRLKGKYGFMALKLDMSKAYDRVEWEFLLAALSKMASSLEWSNLLYLLECYEKASGQRLNKEKTSIYFSKNTPYEIKAMILSIAGVRSSCSYERYLGLPAFVGRSRSKAFSSILDRVSSKICNWKNKFLSKAGKEVLLKAVIQALPTYCMGVFKLPKGLLGKINNMMRQFWWGQQEGERKINWISWRQMSKSKSEGRLGYRDFESFNIALLAKQCWRLLQSPDSLVGQRIGDGAQVCIWKDRWIPQPDSFKIQSSPTTVDLNEKVASLIDPVTKGWNYSLISSWFSTREVDLITQLPVSTNGCPDMLVWRCNQNGLFTVRSAYHLQMELLEKVKGQCSTVGSESQLWLSLWNLNVPRSVLVFMWRACLESLPTKLNLYKRRVVDSPMCPICLSEEESSLHAIWSCLAARDVWCQGFKKLQKAVFDVCDFKGLLKAWFSHFGQDQVEVIAVIAHKIWQRRNKLLFEEEFTHPSDLMRLSL